MSTQDDIARQAWITHAHARLGPVDVIAHNRASPSSDLASAREAAKAELTAAAAAMAIIRVSMNSLEPACRLSPDVLVQIFMWARELDPPQYSPYGSYRVGWLTLTQVCNFWRNTALECRSLWRQMVLTLGPAWAELFSARSDPSPMFVAYGGKKGRYVSTDRGIDCVHKALEHLIQLAPQRIAGVDFVASWTAIEPVLSLVFTHATSLTTLDTLHLKTNEKHGILQLPDNTFSTPLTSLSSLTLPDALLGVPWTLFPPTLKSVTIVGTNHSPKAKESREVLTGLYRLLRRSNNLTYLSLNFETLPSWSNIAGKKGLDLPLLRVLQLNGKADGCLSALRSINSLQGLCKLEIAITDTDWATLNVASFLPAIQSVSNSSVPDPFLRLSMSGEFKADYKEYRSQLSLHAHRASEYSHLVDLDPSNVAQTSPSLSVKFATTEKVIGKSEGRELMLKLHSSVNTTRLESLHLAVEGLTHIGWTASDWMHHFRTAQSVHYLHVGKDAYNLFYALGSSTHSASPTDEPEPGTGVDDALEPVTEASNMLFPQLRSFVCEDVNFKEVVHYRTGIPTHQAFTRALTARLAFSGVPRRITMKSCRLDREQVKWWAATVPARMRDWDADTLCGRGGYSNSFY
ncbi:hypothetical protein PENSPDRAFT_738179 [Peniophora sp. CONT]|nr:hypothetical protein PENSPDRAFT_738179 [Peniophora sp. CONT]